MRQSILVLIIIGFTSLASAQTHHVNSFFDSSDNESNIKNIFKLNRMGRFYYDKNWNAGNVYMNNGDTLSAYYLRYDLISNQLEIIIGNEIYAMRGESIKMFEWFNALSLKKEKFIRGFVDNGQQSTPSFLRVLQDGTLKLLKAKKVVAFKDATSPTLVSDTGADIQIMELLYLEKDNSTYEITRSKRKNLAFINSSDVEQYVSYNNLKFSNINDLRQIVTYYNDRQ